MSHCAISHEIDEHLARQEKLEAEAERLDDWFSSLPDAKRAELLWDYIDRGACIVAGVCKSKIEAPAYGRIVSINADLSGDFMEWLADRPEWRAEA